MSELSPDSRSLWRATGPDVAYDRDVPVEVDVAVVGGGITGLTTALYLKESGARVAVLEARRIGSGTTGGTTAKVTAQHGLIYTELEGRHGRDAARRYGAANQWAVDEVARIVDRLGIDCQSERVAAYVYATDEQQRSQVESEAATAAALGLPASFDIDSELPYDVTGTVRFADQMQLHPLRYLHGLASAVDGDGSVVAEQARVRRVETAGRLTAMTERGRVRAERIVLATLLPILDRGLAFARATPSRAYGLAARIAGEPPAGMYISAGSPTRSVRRHVEGDDAYLVVVGESHPTGRERDTERHYDALTAFARQHWDGVEVAYRWSAQDYMPADGLPYIGALTPLSDRIQVATGFRKWGLTNATVAARIIADTHAGRTNEWASLFDATRFEARRGGRRLVRANAEVAQRFVADRLRTDVASPAQLQPGEGGITRMGSDRVAVSRDDDGTLTALSPVCTHLGCIVQWNRAERSWDCPCHGSRFAPDGSILTGPATSPLRRHQA